MTGCRVFWGTHGCSLEQDHEGDCLCDCYDEDVSEGEINVGAPPYYGPDTRFYGADAVTRGLPIVETADLQQHVRKLAKWPDDPWQLLKQISVKDKK